MQQGQLDRIENTTEETRDGVAGIRVELGKIGVVLEHQDKRIGSLETARNWIVGVVVLAVIMAVLGLVIRPAVIGTATASEAPAAPASP